MITYPDLRRHRKMRPFPSGHDYVQNSIGDVPLPNIVPAKVQILHDRLEYPTCFVLCPLPDPAQIIPKSVSITHKESVIWNQLPIIWTVEMDLRIAKKYRLVRKIGAGAFGMIYRGKLTAYHIFNATLLINILNTLQELIL